MTVALTRWVGTCLPRVGRILLALYCLSRVVSGITLAPVHWNSSNPLFKESENGATVEVSLYDQIDFVCPYYSPDQDNSSLYEYYTVYQVTKQSYDNCNTSSRDSIALIVNCSNPFHQKRFTILFEMFQAIPNVPEFVPGNTYYYISTSTGQRDGLANTYLGACDHLNMRLIVHVCCDTKRVEFSELSTLRPQSSLTSSKRHEYSSVLIISDVTKQFLQRPDNDDSWTNRSPNYNIPHEDSNSRKGSKSTENEVSPKHQGLRNRAGSLQDEHLLRFACLILSLLLFWR